MYINSAFSGSITMQHLTDRERYVTGDEPTRYRYVRGGITREAWYCSVLVSQDPDNRKIMTLELLDDWRQSQSDRRGRMVGGHDKKMMDQFTFNGTMTYIECYASSLPDIKNLLFPDPNGGIYISDEMKTSAIPSIIAGTLRILGEMTEFANLTLDSRDMMMVDKY